MPKAIEYKHGQAMPNTLLTFDVELPKVNPKERRARFQCACGGSVEASIAWVKHLNTTSCGCVRVATITEKNTTHGKAVRGKPSGAYRSWQAMKQRAGSAKNYEQVRVCLRWESFENFLADMGERPEGMTIERKDSNGHYEPSNCVWATSIEQAQNTSQTASVTINGVTQSINMWCRFYDITYGTVKQRRARGMSLEDAITTPLDQSKRGKKRGDF